MIEFSVNFSLPELYIERYSGIDHITIHEVTKGIDSVSYLGGGR